MLKGTPLAQELCRGYKPILDFPSSTKYQNYDYFMTNRNRARKIY